MGAGPIGRPELPRTEANSGVSIETLPLSRNSLYVRLDPNGLGWAGGSKGEPPARTAGRDPAGVVPDVVLKQGGDQLSSPSTVRNPARASDRRFGT